MGHPYNITVGNEVILENNVNLHKGRTIGVTNRGDAGLPRIGNDVLIAFNSYGNVDVSSHSVVIGNPTVIHEKENFWRYM